VPRHDRVAERASNLKLKVKTWKANVKNMAENDNMRPSNVSLHAALFHSLLRSGTRRQPGAG
jgi:hypothetical protein